jgi:hypothetical protein
VVYSTRTGFGFSFVLHRSSYAFEQGMIQIKSDRFRHERIGSQRETAASSQCFLWSAVGSVLLGVDHAYDNRRTGYGGVGQSRES